MRLIKKEAGHAAQAPGHTGQSGLVKLAAGKDPQRFPFIISHFVPGGGMTKAAAPAEIIYYCITGKILVKGKEGEFMVEPGDLIFFSPGDEREFTAMGSDPTTILVVASPNPK
jgi:quercetin dioxygenase-like cupin family protein